MTTANYLPRRKRSRVLGSALAFLLTATTVATAPATIGAQEAGSDGEAVQFTFENLQPADGFFFTEAWVGLHNGDFDLFNPGERATPGLEALAEGGNTELLGSEFAAPGRLQATVGNGDVQFISPGEVIQGSIDVINPENYRYASFASMLIPTNDAFFGNEDPTAYELFDENGDFTGPVTIEITAADLYDSGTEVNDAQGAAGFSLGFDGVNGGESTDDPTGLVAPHPGFDNLLGLQTAAGTTVTSALAGDEVVARITIDLGDSINTQSAVGPLFEGSVVEDDVAAPDTFRLVDGEFGRYLEAAFGNADTVTVPHSTTAWQLLDAGDGTYYIQNAYTGRFLDADGAGDGYNVGLADSSDEGIRWSLEDAGDGSYYIVNEEFGRLLNSTRPGFNVNTGTEPGASTSWTIVPIEEAVGAVFAGTNDLEDNTIASFSRGADGTLTHVGNFSTGGAGSTEFDGGEGLDPLISADSIVVTEDEQFLLTVNAGSDTISSFRINDDFSLELISVIDSGGVGPNSVAVQNGYVFVTNIDRDGIALGDPDTPRGEPNDEGNVVGFRISDSGELSATGYSADLDNRPANIGFNAEGNTILVSSITSGSAALTGPNAEASLYSFAVDSDGALSLSDTGTPTLRGNAEGRNLPSAIDFDVQTIGGNEFVVVTEAREFNSEGAPPALPALQAGSVTVYQLAADGGLTITESDLATTDGDPAAPNAFGADGQQLTACWIDFGHDGSTFYVSNAINATISSFTLNADGSVDLIDVVAAAGASGFAEEGVAVDGPTTFGTTDGFIDLDVSPDGNQLYQLAGLSGEIYVFDVEDDGSLTQTQIISDGLPEIDTQGIISIG